MKLAKQEHQKAYDAAAALAAASPENEEVKVVALPQTVAYHAAPYFAHHPYAYSAPIAYSAAVKTIVPSGFSYSVHSAPQFAYAQHLPYVIAA